VDASQRLRSHELLEHVLEEQLWCALRHTADLRRWIRNLSDSGPPVTRSRRGLRGLTLARQPDQEKQVRGDVQTRPARQQHVGGVVLTYIRAEHSNASDAVSLGERGPVRVEYIEYLSQRDYEIDPQTNIHAMEKDVKQQHH